MTDREADERRYYVYVIGSRYAGDCRTYVGWTLDVERRLREHNAGCGAKSTRGRGWSLLHAEAFATKREAMSREWRLKRDRVFRRSLRDAWAQPPQARDR